MTFFEIKCCNRKYQAKRYKVKPYLEGCYSEEYKTAICTQCGQLIVERTREFNDNEKRYLKRLKGHQASFYLLGLDTKEIKNTAIAQGCKSNANWFFGINNKIYDLNLKSRDYERNTRNYKQAAY